MPKLSWTIGIKPFIGATTYYTDQVLAITYMNGRTSYLDQFKGSTMAVTLKNQTNVAANFTFGSRVVLNDDLSFIVTGISFEDYPGNTGLSTCTVYCTDYLQASGRTQVNTEALTAANTLAQLQDVYTRGGNTTISYVGGASTADAYSFTGRLLQRFEQALTLEATGAVQLAETQVLIAGRNIYAGTYFRTTFTRATSTGSNVSYQAIRRVRADEKVANRISVDSDTDATITASDNTSITTYGVYADSVSIVDTTVDQATGLAQWLANSRSDPAMETFEIDVVDTAQTQNALDRILNVWFDDTAQAKVHDLVYRVPGAGSDTTAVVFLEGTRLTVTPQQTRLTYYFSPMTLYQFFLLDNTTQGILDTSRLGW